MLFRDGAPDQYVGISFADDPLGAITDDKGMGAIRRRRETPRDLERIARLHLHLPCLRPPGHRVAVHARLEEGDTIGIPCRNFAEYERERVANELEFDRFRDHCGTAFLELNLHVEALGVIGFGCVSGRNDEH